MNSFYDIDTLKSHLRSLRGDRQNKIALSPEEPSVETIDTLEEVYWVEERDPRNPWILVRGQTELLLFCPHWFYNARPVCYRVRCIPHGYAHGVAPFPEGWPCTCQER